MICIGVVGALQPEIGALTADQVQAEAPRYVHGDLLVAVSGMGAERARRSGKQLIEAGAAALVSWGCAAALDSTLRPGALLLPTAIVAHTGREWAVDAEWQRRLLEGLHDEFPVHSGPLAESPHTLATAAEKRALAQRSGAVAADMESAALAALAYEMCVPFLAVRAVSDGADAAVPAPLERAVRADGTLRVAFTACRLALSPWQWPAVLQLATGFRAAMLTLRRVAPQLRACAPPQRSALRTDSASSRVLSQIESTGPSVLSASS